MGRGVPDRWLPYSCLSLPIQGTRFVAFKVPLKVALCQSLERKDWFTPATLLEKCPRLSLVVDLTNTGRYYHPHMLTSHGVKHQKILVPGKVIPHKKLVQQFTNIVDNFLSQNSETDSLIGVHCTHGLNRTSFFICSYMIDRLKIPAAEAISAFEVARGHKIERQEYIKALLGGDSVMEPKPTIVPSPLNSLYKDHNESEKSYSRNYQPSRSIQSVQSRKRQNSRPGPYGFGGNHWNNSYMQPRGRQWDNRWNGGSQYRKPAENNRESSRGPPLWQRGSDHSQSSNVRKRRNDDDNSDHSHFSKRKQLDAHNNVDYSRNNDWRDPHCKR